MRYIYFLPFFVGVLVGLTPSASLAQCIEPSALASSSGFGEGKGGSLSWTVGQLVSETRTYEGGTITEGVQQPLFNILLIHETPTPLSMLLFPNPVHENLLVSLRGAEDDIILILYNILGTPVSRHMLSRGDSMLRIPVAQLAEGMYLIAAFSPKGERLEVYKFIKTE